MSAHLHRARRLLAMTALSTVALFLIALIQIPPAFAGNGFRAHCQDRDGRSRVCRLNFTGSALEIHRDAFNDPDAIAYADITKVTRIASATPPAQNAIGAIAVPLPSGVPAPIASGSAVITIPPSRTTPEESMFALYYFDSTHTPHALLIKLATQDAPGLAAQFEALTGRSVQSAP